jgi:DNA-binding SARP family transcriptional activator
VYQSGSYELNPEIELWTDVEQFEYHYANGRRLEKEGNSTAAIIEYEKAEKLYRGDYLEEEPYDDRTLIRREALKDTYLIVMGKLADHLLQSRDYEGSIAYSQKIIAKDNCREDSYRRLMRCYSRLGNRNRAIRWYEICCQAIQAELDATPEHETIHLYQLLFSDDNI